MPTYDYRCTACKHQWEEFQSITAKPLKKCPACGKAKAERLIGMGAAVVFKGGGFYQTDYRSEAYKAAAKADAAPADSAAKPASDSASSSSTPATTPTTPTTPTPATTATTPASSGAGAARASKAEGPAKVSSVRGGGGEKPGATAKRAGGKTSG